MCALGAEVIWTRLLSLLLGATVYTFSIILAVFLIGLGLGSGAGSFLARRATPRIALGFCQLFSVVAVAWAAFMIVNSLPYWHITAAHFQNRWGSAALGSICCAARGRSCRRRSCGERVSPSPWRLRRLAARTLRGSSEELTRPIRPARSRAPSDSAWC